ncbi:hemophore-related protein [Nocardia fluminea]|jgi:hemophore-related protein|uniref:hemophore-related protein n=1 Tax=Nocardia fluminea TaxID=134984 RepID=UPI0034106EDF
MKKNLPGRTPFRIALMTGSAALAVAGTVGAATASPTDRSHPLLDTTCSLEQIEAATAALAPDLAAQMAEHPEHRAALAALLSKSPQERRAMIEQRHGEHGGRHDGERADQHARMLEVLEVCGSY